MTNNYGSPRWSGELLDCSLPVTLDTYNKCSYNCLYCFSFFQKSHTTTEENYQTGQLKWINRGHIHNLLKGQPTGAYKTMGPFFRQKKVIQWGGLADQFDEYERRKGITLETLKLFKAFDYPICFSTKAVWWLDDDRYLKLFRGQDNWNMKFSIINLDPDIAAKIEIGCPSPQARLDAIGKYTQLNKGGATLRLRPFIIGLGDRNDEYIDLLRLAREKGATAVSTEFFCLESRADDKLLARYQKMSEILGFDIFSFYMRHSRGPGYQRLNYKIKTKYFARMEEECKRLGLRFYVSDAHHKERCPNGSCCGLDPSWNYSRGQFTEALMIAKKNGVVHWDDIASDLEIYRDVKWLGACGFNCDSTLNIAKFEKMSFYDYFRYYWNSPSKQKSPFRYFNGVLTPVGIDNNNNVIYGFINKSK